MSGRETEKAQGYINALDNARSEDKWSEVPELIRKVTKHAPHRKCLIQTANAEVQVIAHINNKRPSTAKGQTSPNQVSNLSDLIPTLLSIIEQAEGTPQDVFQAQVCLGWIHWTLSEPGLALGRLPKDFDESSINDLTHATEGIAKWTEVCIVKGGYIKTAAQSQVSGSDDALNTASSVLARLATPKPTIVSCSQVLYWSEKFLSKLALIAGEKACERDKTSSDTSTEIALKAFRLWSVHPQVKRRDYSSGNPSSQLAGASETPSETSMWMSYYELLSTILQQNMTYFPPSHGPSRSQLATEIRRVETVCERVLLREVRFPRANARNPQVESWVERVIRNWEALCGPEWRDADFGEGGQDAVGRNVLDILYRAATKTYHSYLILRRLFHVHAALAEFELAIKALDSYIEIVVSAKERAEKGAEAGELEKDEILLQTVSEGVIILSCFGSQKEAEKAKSLIEVLEKFLGKDISADVNHSDINGQVLQTGNSDAVNRVSPKTIAMGYRAIGIGLANWSRWTPVNESRDDIRAEAIENLERSIALDLGDELNLSSLYALALLLAESRDLDGSIAHVKAALSTKSPSSDLTDVALRTDQTRLSRERDLIPLWHLLALLLSAKQDFDIAGRSCEAAFEQFPTSVFSNSGKRRHRDGSQRGRRDSTEIRIELLQQLRGREKERILETRMSQLALIEVLEGPEAALNHSNHLLTLFGTLFEHLEFEIGSEKAPNNQKQLTPPKSAAGTVKSFRGSIFGRKKGSRVPERRNANGSENETIPALPTQESASLTDAPTIQVTDETTGGSVSLRHQGSHRLPIPKGPHETNETSKLQDGEEAPPSTENVGIAVADPAVSPTSATEPKQSAKQPLPPVAHNMKYDNEPRPAGHAQQPPEQDVRVPPPHRFESPTRALTRFPDVHAQKHALTILLKVWLFIAGLYRRASLFEDAREAWVEAFKQATNFEALVSAQESSARAFSERPWGVGKSADELWGDVYAERGALSEAQSLPHEAMEHYEEALMRYPDHPKATIGLANLLLDIWEEKIPAEIPRPGLEANVSSTLSFSTPKTHLGVTRLEKSTTAALIEAAAKDERAASQNDDEQKYIGRLAARDRAYGLLSTLTKLGSSWDNSEAWFALSRAYEAGSQLEKTKEILWWCVELEDRKPIRHWWNLGSGGYVL